MKRVKITLCILSVSLIGLCGCGSQSSKNIDAVRASSSATISNDSSSKASTLDVKNSENHTTEKVDIQTTNTVDDKQNSMQKLTSSMQTWIVDKNNFRADFNSYSPDVAVLESGDVLKTIDNLQKLEADYNSLHANYNLLVKDTSNIMGVLEKNPELKQDPNVKDMVLAIGQAGDDVGTINKIIKVDVNNAIEIANKVNSGNIKNSDVFLPHSNEFYTAINDFKAQNLKIEQCLEKIK